MSCENSLGSEVGQAVAVVASLFLGPLPWHPMDSKGRQDAVPARPADIQRCRRSEFHFVPKCTTRLSECSRGGAAVRVGTVISCG